MDAEDNPDFVAHGSCPACLKRLDCAKGIFTLDPSAHDVVVCLWCGTVLQFDHALHLRVALPNAACALPMAELIALQLLQQELSKLTNTNTNRQT